MAFKNTQWELSDKVASPSQTIEFGLRYLFIENATYDAEKKEYKIYVKDLTNEATYSLTYWLEGWNKDKTARVDNQTSIGTLNTLGEALAGVNIGIPNPQDIIGGVVLADVKESKPNEQGRTYARVFEFKTVPGDIAALANIEQYYDGAVD